MPDRYAPALLLDVFAFWFVLRWVLPAAIVLLFARVLVALMAVGTLGALGEHHYVWTAFFAASAVLSWLLLRRWRGAGPRIKPMRLAPHARRAWRRVTPDAVAVLCERRIGERVDAAVPATLPPSDHCVLALAGSALWVLEDSSGQSHPEVGRVLAAWARDELVSHLVPTRRGQQLELSWPRHNALVLAALPTGPLADAFAGQLLADELSARQ
jgi:hypothetical protein